MNNYSVAIIAADKVANEIINLVNSLEWSELKTNMVVRTLENCDSIKGKIIYWDYVRWSRYIDECKLIEETLEKYNSSEDLDNEFYKLMLIGDCDVKDDYVSIITNDYDDEYEYLDSFFVRTSFSFVDRYELNDLSEPSKVISINDKSLLEKIEDKDLLGSKLVKVFKDDGKYCLNVLTPKGFVITLILD